jgi:2-polyprenyl-3-methyl-5-hydroxy-6-metoxy-1,4-benzoquinol methylase
VARRIFLTLLGVMLLVPALGVLATQGWLGQGAAEWMLIQERALRFNWIYAGNETPFRSQPNEFLVRTMEGRAPGRALDVAMGQGRNSLYLASRGWQVTGFDIAGSGLRVCREAARARSLSVETVQATVEEFDYGREKWDLVVLIYVPVRWDDAAMMRRIRDSVKPGGWVVVEAPVERQRVAGDLAPGQLERVFEGFRFVSYDESPGMTEWFPRETIVARMVAEKP